MSQRAELPALRVLVVEDDPEQREAIVRSLNRLGCVVDSAKDGYEAYRLARKGRPRVILMDLSLPSMSGWEAIRIIRERPGVMGGDHAPHIIAYSAFDTPAKRRAAFEAGCNEFVAKPLDVTGAIRAYAVRHAHAVKALDDDGRSASR